MSNGQEIKNLFVTPVYGVIIKQDNKKIANYCNSLVKKIGAGRKRSAEGGWQSGDLVGDHPPLSNLISTITKHVNKYCSDIQLKKTSLDNIWVNINGYKDSNTRHCHPNALVSGVYYVKTPKQSGQIVLEHPSYDTFGYDWHQGTIKNFNQYTSARWFIDTQPGKLLLFPGWLNHYVTQNLNKKEERISISFNYIAK